MSTLNDRPNEALVVIDVQRAVFASAFDRDGVVGRIRELVDHARNAGRPVIWVRHSESPYLELGSDDWQIVDELTPAEGEPVVEKTYGDSFEGTDLESVLERLGVSSLLVTGGQSDFCIRSTIHGGFTRGYDVTLVADAHSTEDLREWEPDAPSPEAVIKHTNLY